MGYGDNEPPGIRADASPATLSHANRFDMLFLTFVDWDIIKLRWSLEGGSPGYLEIGAGAHGITRYSFEPAQSDGRYTFTAQGCSKAVDGSTGYCSPESAPFIAVAAHNTNSLKQFLEISGIDLRNGVDLRMVLRSASKESSLGLRTLMSV